MAKPGMVPREREPEYDSLVLTSPPRFEHPSSQPLGAAQDSQEASANDWANSTEGERKAYLMQIEAVYLSILDEFFDESNSCVRTVKASDKSHASWRRGLIITTGGLAMVNLLAAYKWPADGPISSLALFLPLFAALYAAILAIVMSLESFYNFPGKAQAYRESRELFLDAYREFEMLWHVKVRPLGIGPEACVGAAEAYRLLVLRDRELRGKLKELTATKKTTEATRNSNV